MKSYSECEQALYDLWQMNVGARDFLNTARGNLVQAGVKTVIDNWPTEAQDCLTQINTNAENLEDIAAQDHKARADKLTSESNQIYQTSLAAAALFDAIKSVFDTADLSNGLTPETKATLLATITALLS